ncbi:LapA family protein [Deefgea tanakiae]|nr:lipopolysaccharide assembly protein LapA domain-containing protein [Deefgea tanakiae]
MSPFYCILKIRLIAIYATILLNLGVIMRYLFWLIKFIGFVLLFGFAMHNANPVRLNFYLGSSWEAPLALILLVFLVLGAAIGLLANLGQVIRLRREVLTLRKERRLWVNEKINKEAEILTPPLDAI